MRTSESETAQRAFSLVAENLYKHTSGTYYALFKKSGKQFRRSLKTGDRKLAERKLATLKAKIGDLVISDEANASYGQLARHWLDVNKHALAGSTVKRTDQCIRMTESFFNGNAIRNVRPIHCEKWVLDRGADLSASSFNHELETMRGVFDYARKRGLILDNPAADIARKKIGRPELVSRRGSSSSG